MKIRDIICIALLIAVGGLLWLFLRPGTSADNATVRISVDGTLYGTYDLDTDQEIDIQGTNTCVISEGRVYMSDADCPDHLCVKTGSIAAPPASIVCLPNKVVIEIEKSADSIQEEPDAVAR